MMTERPNRWEPVTDEYKQNVPDIAEIEAQIQQKLHDLRKPVPRSVRFKAKAPIGIRIFTWYYFSRVAVCSILLVIFGLYPEARTSVWLSDNISNFLRLPGSKAREDASRRQIEKIADAYNIPENAITDPGPEVSPETARTIVKVYLAMSLMAGLVVGLKWWTRSRRVRWGTMLYAGVLVGKAGINLAAGRLSGGGVGRDPSQFPMLVLTFGINALIILYLAFWPGVDHWFEQRS